jgi:16S rRNA (adenine1518-N6/adenine1519-N6)-dimethyltransferase
MTEPWREWEDPRRVLKRHGLRPKRAYSQNFLVSERAVESIARAVNLPEGTQVIELGPGVGTLTSSLARRGWHITAVERDPAMRDVLRQEFGSEGPVEIIDGDAAKVDFARLGPPPPCTVFGNLPYSITGAIFRNLLGQPGVVKTGVFMVQREVRDRLLASPSTKQYGALSVFVGAAYTVSPVCLVKAGAFFPAPRVDSAVVRLEHRGEDAIFESESFRAVVSASFQQRRKTLRNALSTLRGSEFATALCAAASIDSKRRGETLSVEEFQTLAQALEAS